jgi:transposase
MSKIVIKEKEQKKILPMIIAIANSIIKELGLVEKINEAVKWDESRNKVSPGGLIKALVISTFTDIRTPLNHISSRLSGIDIGQLIGENIEPEEINAFNAARALDKLSETDHSRLYQTAALTAIKLNDMPMQRLHGDTTTVSFYGEYDDDDDDALSEEEKSESLKIERGYNKDGRPQCNQVVVGQIVNETGIPAVQKTMNGSTSDVKWNKEAVNYLSEIISEGFKEGIFVADSKLVTAELVKSMCYPDSRINFVSRCPANFSKKLESRMIEKAYKAGQWEDIGKYGENKNSSVYKGISFIETVCGCPMRLLVLQSSALEEKAIVSLCKEKEKINPTIAELQKKRFACFEDANREFNTFMGKKASRLFDFTGSVEKETEEIWAKGRRGKESKPKIKESYAIKISKIDINEAKRLEYMNNNSCIVIISNVVDSTNNKDLLGIYKGQRTVENSFRKLKGPNLASAIYLKKPNRIEALTTVLSLSLLVQAIIQYKLRAGLKKFEEANPGKVLKVGWQDAPLKKPTYKLIYEYSINCYFERSAYGEYGLCWGGKKTQVRVSTYLSLMELDLEKLLE